jgi:glycosyltransferase involved in cell wall biosynthesis
MDDVAFSAKLETGAFKFELELDASAPLVTFGDSARLNGRFRHDHTTAIELTPGVSGAYNIGVKLFPAAGKTQLFEDRMAADTRPIEPGTWIGVSVLIPRAAINFRDSFTLTADVLKEDEFWFASLGGPAVEAELTFTDGLLQPVEAPPLVPSAARILPAPVPATKRNTPKALKQTAPPPAIGGRYIFDISDLIQFWRDNINPTGIQRVQIEVLKAIIQQAVAPEFHDAGVATIYFDAGIHQWAVIANDALLPQIHASYRHGMTKSAWAKDMSAMLAKSSPYTPAPSDTILNLGSSWWIPDYLHKMQCLRLESGVRYIPFVHDTIPLIAPQFCTEGLVEEFRLWFRGAMAIADHIIVNSNSSRNDVSASALELTGHCADITVARLNAAFPPPVAPTRTGIVERYNLDIDRYVLCVGTLEARKNHALLLQVWTDLAKVLKRDKMARLVLVGKQGWMFDLARSLLNRDPSLKKSVLILDNLSDNELSDLYRNCLFTVYPSFYEGWGLPITEAVSYGKLTVASNTSSIPEAASAGDILLDPNDAPAWRQTIQRLLEDDAFLEASTKASHQLADIRGWADVANDILHAARTAQPRYTEQSTPPIADGQIYDFSIKTARERFGCSALPFRAGPGWHHLEDWGAWSAPGITELRFKVANAESRYFYLVLRGAQDPIEISITVDRDSRASLSIAPGARVIFRADLIGTPKFQHTVRVMAHNPINLAEKTNGADTRRIGIGFLNICCTKASDIASRLNFLETMQMQFI